MSREAMKLALGKIKSARDCHPNAVDTLLFEAEEILEGALAQQPARPYRLLQDNGSKYFGDSWDKAEQPAQQALDKMAENARELGIQMQPAQQEPVAYAVYHRMGGGKSLHWPEQHSPDGDANEYQLVPLYTSSPTLSLAQQEPVGCEGAIVNGRVYADRLEHDYRFECEAGPLHLCNDWVEFRRCFEWLAQHTSPPAQRTWVELTDDDIDGIYQGAGKNDLKRAREVIAAFKERNT